MQCFTDANMDFQQKIIERSGLGDETGLSDGRLVTNLCDAELMQNLCSLKHWILHSLKPETASAAGHKSKRLLHLKDTHLCCGVQAFWPCSMGL